MILLGYFYHLQMLVDGEGNMRDWVSFLSAMGTWHIGYLDAFVHLLLAGNRAKSLWQDHDQKVLSEVLQVCVCVVGMG